MPKVVGATTRPTSPLPREDDKNKIYFSLPDFYNYYDLNLHMVKLMKDYPGYFRSNVVIDSVYGSFPGCIWNGGRVQYGGCHLENMQATIAGYNQLGISVRFTFTNRQITGRHHMDYYGNTILQVADNGMNGVNTSVDTFADYVQANYPSYYLINSTTRKINGVDDINELSETTLTVPPYTINNTDAIDKLTHPENIELLCCETCIDNCPNRSAHYDCLSTAQMLRPTEPFKCPHGCELYYYYETVPTRKHHISIEMIEEQYLPRGINKFKISGRNDNVINVIERYVNYLAKPEYRDAVRNHVLINHMSNYQRQD